MLQSDDSSHTHAPRSAVAAELRGIPLSVRRSFGVPGRAPDVLDAVALTLHDLLDTDSGRGWQERIEAIPARFADIFPDVDLERELLDFLENLDAAMEEIKSDVEKYLRRFKNGSAQRFLRRVLGADRYLKLQHAVEEDWALCLLAVRRMLRSALPLAQALEDAVTLLSDDERDAYKRSPGSDSVFLGLLLKLDEAVGSYLDKRGMDFSTLGFPARENEEETLDIDLQQLMEMLRVLLDVEMDTRTSDLSDILHRKFRGFEQALNASDDGVGQAATSLIELIDRLLRTAGSTAEVLAWLRAHRPGDGTLVYVKDGKTRPTKMGEALYFAHGGEAPGEDSRLQEMLAHSIVRARSRTQQIKHADRGTPEEAVLLRDLMRATRGAITFLFRVSWTSGSPRYEDLRTRFAQAA